MVVLVARSKVVAFRVLGSGRAQIVARLIVGVRVTVSTGVEFLGTLMGVAWSKVISVLVQAKVEAGGASRVKRLGLGWVVELRLVSAGNPKHRKGSGRRGGGREGPVPGAGIFFG